MKIIFNYNDINSIDTKREEVNGIYSNAFPPFSQNSLGCRYGFFKKHGSTINVIMYTDKAKIKCIMFLLGIGRVLISLSKITELIG